MTQPDPFAVAMQALSNRAAHLTQERSDAIETIAMAWQNTFGLNDQPDWDSFLTLSDAIRHLVEAMDRCIDS